MSASNVNPLYKDAAASVDARTADLLAKMTLEEKVAQMLNPVGSSDDPHGGFVVNAEQVLLRYNQTGLGTLYTGVSCANISDRLACQNYLQAAIMSSSRLGIPISFIGETLVSGTAGGTIFPQPVLRGCAFNTELESAIGVSISRQARIGGIDRGLSPVLQVDTDVRFGRFEESYGEDPFLVSTLGVAVATALQGGAEGPHEYVPSNASISCEAKHALAYGEGGRDWYGADMTNRTLFDVYAKPWHRAIRRAGLRGAMIAHQDVNGLPLHGNKFIMTNVLRDWFGSGPGSNGTGDALLLASDWGNVEQIPSYAVAVDAEHAAALAAWSGLDNTMSPPPQAFSTLVAAVQSGLLNVKYVDRAAANNLREKFATGLFDGAAHVDPAGLAGLDTPADRALARYAAGEGIVLLKNDVVGGAPLLPLVGLGTPGKARVALLGPLAACQPGEKYPCLAQMGVGGHYTQYGAPIVTLGEALGNVSGVQLTTVVGANIDDYNTSGLAAAVAAAAAADLVIVAVGDSIPIGKGSCSEMHDADTADLPGGQLALLDAVAAAAAAAGKPLIVVLFNCRPATFGSTPFSTYGPNNALLGRLPAVVAAWRPGEEAGNAVVDMLTGVVPPSGRLTQNWVRTAGAVKSPASPYLQYRGAPDNDYVTEPATPMFYFGHGLQYSNVTVSGAALSPDASHVFAADEALNVTGTIAVGAGERATRTTLLLFFAADAPTKRTPYARQLFGFTKVDVPAGGAPANFTLTASIKDLDSFEPDVADYVVHTGHYYVTLASDVDSAGHGGYAQWRIQVNGTYTWTWDFSV